MKKLIALVIVLAFGFMPVLTGSALAEKKHTAKPVWHAMVANLNDMQSILGALVVFDMARVADIADQLAGREKFISTLEFLPEEVRKRHAKVGDVVVELANAARAGDEQEVSMKIGAVMAECSSCHYNVRDAERRKEMENKEQ